MSPREAAISSASSLNHCDHHDHLGHYDDHHHNRHHDIINFDHIDDHDAKPSPLSMGHCQCIANKDDISYLGDILALGDISALDDIDNHDD